MTTSLTPNTTFPLHTSGHSRVVPPAAVWEPKHVPLSSGAASDIRTLERISSRSARTHQLNGAAETARGRAEDKHISRSEQGRTYLLGAIMGFAVVFGTLHLVDDGSSAGQANQSETVSAVTAK